MEETYFIKISGKANIPERLEVDKNYHIACDCSITQEQKDSNENGSYNITFKAEPMTVEILKSNGKIIKARDPRRNSQKFRNYLYISGLKKVVFMILILCMSRLSMMQWV